MLEVRQADRMRSSTDRHVGAAGRDRGRLSMGRYAGNFPAVTECAIHDKDFRNRGTYPVVWR